MKKIKVLAAALVLLLGALVLTSCASDVVAYSPDTRISIVRSDLDVTSADVVAYNSIVSAIQKYIGTNCRSITDTLLQSNFEIVVGDTNREVTRLAKEFLAENTPVDDDTESYVFYYKDNAIAIVASSEFSMEIAAEVFVETYLQGSSLVVKSDMLEFKVFSKSAYIAEQDAAITAAEEERWENRWVALKNVVGKEGVEAVQRLYEFWGTEWLEWAAGLYDGEIGGFYYSASARDYIGFAPDIESTAQILALFKTFGLCSWYDGYWGEAFPAQFRQKLASFVQELQSEADGYFYHPQWGESISTAAKGRHLDQALFILGVAGEAPLYRSPLDRNSAMSDTSDVISAFMDTDEHKSSVVYTASTLPDYMQSEEAIFEYLEDQRDVYTDDSGYFNSYSFGHLLSSQTSQLKAAGVIDFVCDYLDALQIPETGLWEAITDDNPDSGYNALSGVIKIGGVYSGAGRAFAHADKMVDTAIEVILNERPAAHVCYIFNPIGAFAKVLSCMRSTGIDITEARQKIYKNLPDMIDVTIEKLKVFSQELGSYCYLPGHSDPASQGLRMSLGLAEGDVNATTVCIDYIGGSLFDLIGVDPVPMFRYSDFKWFCEQVAEAGSPIKQDLVLELLDFEDGDVPSRITVPDVVGLEVEVVDGGADEDGKALQIHRENTSTSAVFTVNMDTVIVPTCTIVELDMNFVSSSEAGNQFSLYLRNENQRRTGFELHFNVIGDGTIAVTECIYPYGGVFTDTLFTLSMDEWFKLRIEYYPISSSEVRVKLYLNDTCIYIGDTPHNNHYTQAVFNGMNRLYFNCFKYNEATVLIDNIYCFHDQGKTFDDSDYLVPPAD